MNKKDELFLRQLRVFVTVAHARSFSRAGEMIG
jgi:DNA-binding transcriptional LysR family regulator